MFVSLATYRDGNDASFASINSCRVQVRHLPFSPSPLSFPESTTKKITSPTTLQSYDSGSRNLKECASGGALAMAGVLLGIMAGSPRPKWDETPLLDKILTVLVAAMTLTGCIVLWVSDGAQIAFTKYNELMDASIFAFLAAYYLVGSMLSRSRPLLTGTAFFISFVLVGHLATLFTVTNEATLDDLALVRTGFSISWSALFLGLVVVVRALWILDDQKVGMRVWFREGVGWRVGVDGDSDRVMLIILSSPLQTYPLDA